MKCLIFGVAIAAIIGIWTDGTRAGVYVAGNSISMPATYR